MTDTLAEAVVEVREVVQDIIPDAPDPVASVAAASDAEFEACATVLITRWEIGSQAQYDRKYKGVIWPQGGSGPTWAIGYDGGTQTTRDILADWVDHEGKQRLATTSGVLGNEAGVRVRAGEWRGIITPFGYAGQVFSQRTLPQYTAAARRALGPGFVSLPTGTRCALVSLGYNRGWSMAGPRRAEMREIRTCVQTPQDDVGRCVATQLLAMKRLWPDLRGLRDRREDEARVAMGTLSMAPAPAAAPASRSRPPRTRNA